MEAMRGDGDIEGILLEFLHRPGIVRREEDATEFLVLVCAGLDELVGLVGSHTIENVVKSGVLIVLGKLNLFKEVLIVDGLDKLVKVNQEHIFVADQGFGKG